MNVLIGYLNLFSVGCSLVSFIIGMIFRKRLVGYSVPVLVLTIVACFSDVLNLILAYFHVFNSFVFHFYTVVEFILWALFFILVLKNKKASYFIFGITAIFFVVSVIDYLMNGFNNSKNFSNSVEAVFLVGFSFFLFLYNMQHTLSDDLTSQPFFWYNCACLIYFSGNIMLFLMFKYLNNQQTSILWAPIHNVLNIIFNSLIIIGFWKTRYIKKQVA